MTPIHQKTFFNDCRAQRLLIETFADVFWGDISWFLKLSTKRDGTSNIIIKKYLDVI
jgi:hypothetical protein